MSCGITYDKNGNIIKVENEQGQPSKLYQEALNATKNEEEAKRIFLVSKTPSFKIDIVETDIKKYQSSILKKLSEFKHNVPNLKYKVVKTKGFETIQQIVEDRVVGRIRLKQTEKGYKIDSTLVQPDYQGRDLGTDLYKQAIRYSFKNQQDLLSDDHQTPDAQKVWAKLTGKQIAQPEFQILGEKGVQNLDQLEEATFRMDNLKVAKEMEVAGKTPKEIKAITGWEKNNIDKKWRYEINDGTVKEIELNNKVFEQTINSDAYKFKLSDIYNSEELFKAYNKLKDIEVLVYEPSSDVLDQPIMFVYNSKIYINKNKVYGRINKLGRLSVSVSRQSIIHELTHSIQEIEGFAKGSSPKYFEQKVTSAIRGIIKGDRENNYANNFSQAENRIIRNVLKNKTPNENNISEIVREITDKMYENTSGEVEARSVEMRRDMTVEQRRQSLLSKELNISEKDQIFLENSLKQEQTAPQITQEIIDRLKQNGLSEDVFLLSTEEINKKLEELGVNEDVRKQIIVEKGAVSADLIEEASFRIDNLVIAREMEQSGKTPLEIKLATGWERGTSNSRLFEDKSLEEILLRLEEEGIITKTDC